MLAAGVAGGQPVQISQVALGSTQRAATGQEAALVSEFTRAPIQTSTVDAPNRQIELATLFDGPALGIAAAHNVCEVGFYDTQGRLIFYWSTANGSLGALTPLNDFALAFALGLGASPTGAITVVDQGAPGDLVLEARVVALEGGLATAQAALPPANAPAAKQADVAALQGSVGALQQATAGLPAGGAAVASEADLLAVNAAANAAGALAASAKGQLPANNVPAAAAADLAAARTTARRRAVAYSLVF